MAKSERWHRPTCAATNSSSWWRRSRAVMWARRRRTTGPLSEQGRVQRDSRLDPRWGVELRRRQPTAPLAHCDSAVDAWGCRRAPRVREQVVSEAAARVSLQAAGDSDVQGCADLRHADVADPPQSRDEHRHCHAFHRIEVDRAAARYGVGAWLQHDLAGQAPHVRRARGDDRSSQTRDRGVPGKHQHRAAADLGQLRPPHLPARGKGHDAPAADRNDARSPHASGSSIG